MVPVSSMASYMFQERPSCYPQESVCGTYLSGRPTVIAPFLFSEVGLAVIREAMSAVITVRALLRLWLLSCATRLAQLLFAKVRLRHVPFGPSYIHGPVLVLQGRSMGRWGPRAGRERTGSRGNCQAGTRYGGRARHAAGHGCSRFRQKRLLNTLICCNTTASTADFW